ncbi:MAG TPA: FliH/SctL family protein [Aquabacterium sp.]|nr:FliH/SctL family protein [Aquabacterium sp.]
MSRPFLIWHRAGDTRLASTRLVLRAAEVPVLQHAQALRDTLEHRRDVQMQMMADAVAQARSEGHAQGFATAQRESAEQLAATLMQLSDAAAAERAQLRGDTASLALEVVRKLLGHVAEDAVLAALAETAAAELLPSASLVLVVHPAQADAVQDRLAERIGTGGLRFEVRADPACAVDACRLETEHGSVDVALEAQLARLAAAWGGIQPNGPPG